MTIYRQTHTRLLLGAGLLALFLASFSACNPSAIPAEQESAGIQGLTPQVALPVTQPTEAPFALRPNPIPAWTPGGYQPSPPPPVSGQAEQVFIPMPARPTDWPAPTDKPPATPVTADYVPPTNPPPPTPFPTLAPDPTPVPTPAGEATKEPEPISLSAQVTNFTRANKDRVDAIVRVKVLSHENVKTPDDYEWPRRKDPDLYYRDDTPLSRVLTSVEVKETLHGNLPDDYKFMSFKVLPNSHLDIGKEYILFVRLSYVGESDFPGDLTRTHYTEAELGILGSKIASLFGLQSWVVEGDNAWRVPLEHIRRSSFPESEATADSTQLEAAKAHGDFLTVADLTASINAGLE